jgi:hypothetical protein
LEQHRKRRKDRTARGFRPIHLLKCGLLVCLMPTAGADDLLKGDEMLRSAYCIPVVQRQIEAQRRLVDLMDKAPSDARKQMAERMGFASHKQLAKMESVLNQLQASVRPATPFAPGSQLANALEQGARDLDEYFAMQNRCVGKCYSAGPTIDKCEADCTDHSLAKRIETCFALSRLPQ